MTEQQKEKIRIARDKRIWSDIHGNIFAEMEDCKYLSKCGGEPACMLCRGDTGAGKSAVIAKFRDDHKRYEKLDASVIPVVYTVLPTKVSERGLLTSILKSIGPEIVDFKDFDDEEDLLREIVRLVDRLGIELFIIDEAQGFLEHDSRRLVYDATECVKNLIIRTNRPFILFGMPWCLHAVEQNSQLAGRFLRRRYLAPFRITQDQDRGAYIGFLDMLDEEFAKDLGFTEKAGLGSKDIALRLFAVSRGNLRVLRSVIDQAVVNAVRGNASKMEYDHFCQACDIFFPESNPFKIKSLDMIKYVELAKPSYWDKDAKRGQSPVVDQTYTQELKLSEALSAT
ncbi:TniB family NTP-binding protein [Endozoicomonas ascidiicola]|uniref:TniB family NTP-binding protein n=1 Tax=Endozoicomonas ascidiicola TaxID=1698521 RepID=UPI0012F9FC20|nr:TniB family NTP-binding protein [Endozoicomonas ascidiicola]